MLDKPQLRRHFLEQRRALSATSWRSMSDRLCYTLQQMPLFQQAQTVLAYSAIRHEPDLQGLWGLPKRWGLPRCVGSSLVWHRWQVGDRLWEGPYHVLEPDPASPQLLPAQVDLILVPALACDRQGYRLGYGGGYYDRLLSLPDWQSIPTLGMIFDFAYCPELPKDSWDRPLTGICTEQRSLLF